VRSCIAKTDGDILWSQLQNSLDDVVRRACFRANVPLVGSAQIDNIDSMTALRASVRNSAAVSATLLKVAKAALVSNFYLQLDGLPLVTSWGYLVQGSIRCRTNAEKVLSAMANLGIVSVEYSTATEKLCGLGDLDTDVCGACHRYRKNVHFYVRDLSESFSIYIQSRTLAPHKLSGFPETLNWFIKQQKLDSVFGNKYHGMQGSFRCVSCDLAGGIHHKRVMVQDTSTARKRTKIDEIILECSEEEWDHSYSK
jgi:hypothetical protein